MQQVYTPLSLLCLLLFSLSESQATPGSPPRDSYHCPAVHQSTSPAVKRRLAPTPIAADWVELNFALVASMFLKVATDGGWIADFDEDFWLSNPIQPGTLEQARTFFSLKYNDFTLEARLTHSSELQVVLPSGTHTPLTYFPVDKWFKLILELDQDYNINVRVGGVADVNSYPVFGKSTSTNSAEEPLDEDQQESQTESPSQVETHGSVDEVASNKSRLIQVEVCYIDASTADKPWLHMSRLEVARVSGFDISMKCEAQLKANHTFYKQIESDSDTVSTLCKDEFSLIVLPSTISYFDHDEQCKKFQGVVLSNEDVRVYEKELSKISSLSNSGTDENLSWVQSLNDTSESFKSWCSVLLRNATLNMRPCYSSLPSSICKVQTSLPFHLFGRVHKFARDYTLITKPDGTWAIKGFSSLMRYNETGWILQSNLHEETCRTNNSHIPLVRSSWQCGDIFNLTLAFSSCDLDSFSCHSGQCLPRELRCNGEHECYDETDEEMCDYIVKETGYSNLVMPPAIEYDLNFQTMVKYSVAVFSIAPIQTSNFYIDVGVALIVRWRDPRLTIWNPAVNKAVDCYEFWHPKYVLADGYPHGQLVSMVDKKEETCGIQFSYKIAPIKSIDDPYMGRYVNGSYVGLMYTLGGIYRVPCEFNFRKYPFGDQQCEISFWSRSESSIFSLAFERNDNEPEDDVLFLGRDDLREYRVSRIWRKELESNSLVSLFIELKSYYDYHILNIYLPSFLILVISFSTAVFRIKDFNERVMVSLTALLVLTALFTQANSSSIQTPYVKLLDVWYAALIAFSFLTVLANTSLNYYHQKLEAEKELGEKRYDHVTINRRVKILNNILFGSLTAAFFGFMLFYFLSAADKI